MEWNKQTKNLLLVICGGVAFYCALQNLGAVAIACGGLFGILSPLLLGGAIAFVLNVPMRAIERHLFRKKRKAASLRRPLALVLTLLAVMGVLALAGGVIVPGVTDAVMSVAAQIPAAFDRLELMLADMKSYGPLLETLLGELDVNWATVSKKAMALIQSWGKGLLSLSGGLVSGMVSGISTFLISVIFAIYILIQKERLGRQARQVCYALLPIGWADRMVDIARLANRTFSSFFSGQCLEAVILGSLFVAAMSVFRMPYALLVGVLIALTALLPIVGAFIGCAVGALLIALVSPWKALMFIVLFLVLQQIEGNLIYPQVVGSSVGLPSIWVLAAVTLGGKLMGVVGMLIFIPLCSVVYALFRGYIHGKLQEKKIPASKWQDSEIP